MKRHVSRVWKFLVQTIDEWSADNVPTLSAALAYYTMFALAPLVIIVTGVAAIFFGQDAAQGELSRQLSGLLGSAGAETVQSLVLNVSTSTHGGAIATIIGIVTSVVGATGVLVNVQDSLNQIWEVKPRSGNVISSVIKARLLSFGIVLAVGFLLIVSLIVSAVLSALSKFVEGYLSGTEWLWALGNGLISIGVLTVLFAILFKFLPDVKVKWKDTWLGAAITALLFSLGKMLIGLYLGRASVASVFGAAGSFVLILVWIYYSAQIFYFGAELTHVWAMRSGSSTEPKEHAMRLPENERLPSKKASCEHHVDEVPGLRRKPPGRENLWPSPT